MNIGSLELVTLFEEVVDPLGGRTHVEGMGYWGLSSSLASMYPLLAGLLRCKVNKHLIFLLPQSQDAPIVVRFLPRWTVCVLNP